MIPGEKAMTAEIPRSLGRYQIERELGRGMMGIVYSPTSVGGWP